MAFRVVRLSGAEIERRYLAGESTVQIADSLGVADRTIGAWLERRKIERRRGGRQKLTGERLLRALKMYAHADGFTVGEIAAQFGLSSRALHRFAAKAGIRRFHWKVGARHEAIPEVTTEKDTDLSECGGKLS